MRIRIKDDESREGDYPEDCRRIRRVLREHGFEVTMREAARLWTAYSETMAAGWMDLPDYDDVVYWCVRPFFEPDADSC
jgi:hypothetical protein